MKAMLPTAFKFLSLSIVALVIVQFIVSNQLAGLGDKVSRLDRTIQTLSDENELLAQQVASASSLLTISSKAKEMGMVEPSNYLTISPEQFPVALNQPH